MEKIVLFATDRECSGCGACGSACSVGAITMSEDSCGYVYPAIDQEKCVHCGKCLRVCGYKNPVLSAAQCAFAAVGRQEQIVKNSTSGGVFATWAYGAVEQGWQVAGAVMDMENGNVSVHHMLSGSPSDIPRMQGSKYVQSDAGHCYADICKALRDGKNVLFSGTPCQVAAIKALTGDPDQLVTVDVICHGVPPVRQFQEFLNILSKRFAGKIETFSFRDKDNPKPYMAKLKIKKGKKHWKYCVSAQYLSFYQHFLDGAVCRQSCYNCPFATCNRVSDLTIGDYWEIEKYHSKDIQSGQMPNRRDWSCILVNSAKGKAFFDRFSGQLHCYDTNAEWIVASNGQLREPSKESPKRKNILKAYQNKGYAAVEQLYIREKGGKLRFYWRMLKNLSRNCYED